ncbi:hypothetical protein M7I_3941 [Glarea lozoyensis 74030]|uniref:Uncharacterized protein n=1 Tax=Glarea lozoyensis (strain ATCC 74030 / MF5533) TaxID=1104152 RepID=H0EMU3_GLAL7|nr:hypothetical protein M7I_3941 [Glarea lozoyensis 74030]
MILVSFPPIHNALDRKVITKLSRLFYEQIRYSVMIISFCKINGSVVSSFTAILALCSCIQKILDHIETNFTISICPSLAAPCKAVTPRKGPGSAFTSAISSRRNSRVRISGSGRLQAACNAVLPYAYPGGALIFAPWANYDIAKAGCKMKRGPSARRRDTVDISPSPV